MARNYTRELRTAQAEGAKIVGAMQPREGWEMVYAPRNVRDPLPWIATADPLGFRFNGRELKAVTPNGGGPWSVAKLLP